MDEVLRFLSLVFYFLGEEVEVFNRGDKFGRILWFSRVRVDCFYGL